MYYLILILTLLFARDIILCANYEHLQRRVQFVFLASELENEKVIGAE